MDDTKFAQLEKDHAAVHKTEKRLWNRILKERQRRADNIMQEFFAETPTPKQVMQLNYRMVEESNVGSSEPNEWYQAIQGWFMRFKGMGSMGHVLLSEKPWVTQVGLQVQFDQNKPFDEQLDILRFTRWMKGAKLGASRGGPKNAKYIDVFEQSLSEFGSYFIEFTTQQKAKLLVSRYHHVTTEFTGTLRQVLKHVYKKHPYEKFRSEFDDD